VNEVLARPARHEDDAGSEINHACRGTHARFQRARLENPRRMALSARQTRFVQEFMIDLCGKAAAVRTGYSSKTAEVQASRLLRNAKVQTAIQEEMQARRERLRVDADRVASEFARIAFCDIRNFVPREDETFDLRRLNSDLTAAIKNVEQEEVVDRRTGDTRRRLRLKLFDKISALNSLAKHLGMFGDKHVFTGSIEHLVSQMSPAERIARLEQLRAKARAVYLPEYERMLANGERAPQPVIDGTAANVAEPANDNAVQPAEGLQHG